MCSLVPGCWLGFTWAGLSSLIILALLGALCIKSEHHHATIEVSKNLDGQ